jgi:5-methyltetrahydrofolate--homocysteine methyltransferase
LRAIGECINPTGKPQLKESLLEGSMTVVRQLAAVQQQAGADVLDVNVGAAGVDEVATLALAVQAVAGSSTLPISIDTTNAEALEEALKLYPGKALVNSVTGEERSLREVLPLVACYGAAVVVLALDDSGIPDTARGRLEIVKRIRRAASEAGIPDENLLVDSLVMAAAADKDAPRVTLETMQLVREELGLATLLGVSNVSHGLPNRPVLNAAFLGAAAQKGLDAAIVNPTDEVMTEAITLANGTGDLTDQWGAFTMLLEEALKPTALPDAIPADAVSDTRSLSERLAAAITLGDSDGAPALVDALIAEGWAPAAIIEDVLTPAIQALGASFATGEVFLPQLMVAADAMKAAVTQAKTYLAVTDAKAVSRGKVVFATVKGDIHSIGKDICSSLLESQSVTVHDLGVDVPAEEIVKAAANADAVCMSALMTTTLPAMETATRVLREHYPDLPIALGGAVVTSEWASGLDALYAKDAPALAALMVELLAGK